MVKSPSFFTVVGFADMDDGVETFSEVVFATESDAWMVGVAQAMHRDPSREFIRQATEISTFMGICVETHAGPRSLEGIEGPALALDPDISDLYDLQVYRRTYPGETEDAGPVERFHWYDDDDESESEAFDTYAQALSDRYEAVSD